MNPEDCPHARVSDVLADGKFKCLDCGERWEPFKGGIEHARAALNRTALAYCPECGNRRGHWTGCSEGGERG